MPNPKFNWLYGGSGCAFLSSALVLNSLHDYIPAAIAALGAVLCLGIVLKEQL